MRPDPAAQVPERRIATWIDRPVDNTFLAVFRIAFGLLIVLDMSWYFSRGFIREYFLAPAYHFTYFGFGWVHPWPEPWMFTHFAAVGVSGLMMALGWHYRLATLLFFSGFTYLFLIDQSLYLNHNYLICLVGFLMILLPANRVLSLDARSGRAPRQDTAPQWTLWLLRAQIGIVYFYGGIAKINGDWLRGEPLRMWLDGRKDMPYIGQLLDNEFAVYFFSYGGLLYDLLIVPILLWRKTRPLGVLMCLFFHLTNATLFDIGIFPWMMLASTFLFFPPEQIRGWFRRSAAPPTPGPSPASTSRLVLVILAVHLVLQMVVPFRHWLYPGDVTWTEEGHRFSWRMKLRSKQGWLEYRADFPASGRTETISPRRFATERQTARMATRPDMILQGAHRLADEMERTTGERPRVFARSYCTLNGRSPKPLIDPGVDLAAQPRSLRPAPWITPMPEATFRPSSSRREVPTIIPWSEVLARVPNSGDVRETALTRLIRQQAARLERINADLQRQFGIDPDRYYTLSHQTIYELTPRAGQDTGQPVDFNNLASIRRRFDLREHRVLRSHSERARYEDMATRKALLSARLEMLAGMLPASSIQRIELD